MTGIRLDSIATGSAICAVVALTGCSSSNSSAAPPAAAAALSSAIASAEAAAPSTAATPSGGVPSSVLAGILGSGGPLDVSKLCAAVPAADVQKLFKAQTSAAQAFPGECTWGGGGITVDIYASDANKHYYSDNLPTDAKPLSGVGDVAVWFQPVPGATAPFMSAHKGSTTITVAAGLDVDQTTMHYTGSAPFFKIPNASAAQYAAEEGQICNDIFAAAHS
jgi:hypothetical protein